MTTTTYDMSSGSMIEPNAANGLDIQDAQNRLYEAEHNLQLLPVVATESETTDPHPAVIAAALHHLHLKES